MDERMCELTGKYITMYREKRAGLKAAEKKFSELTDADFDNGEKFDSVKKQYEDAEKECNQYARILADFVSGNRKAAEEKTGMLTSEQIREKIYALADDFERYYAQKEYARAKYAYDTASTMAVFMELPREDIYELFANHNPSDDKDAEPVWGRFDKDKVSECYLWCIRHNQTREVMPYHGPRAPGSKELVV